MNRYTEADLARHIKMADDFKARLGVQPCNPAEDGVCEALECCKEQPKALRLADQIVQRDYELSLQQVVTELRTLYYEREGYRESADKNAALFNAMVEQADRDTALLRQALEALEQARSFSEGGTRKAQIAIALLRERLK